MVIDASNLRKWSNPEGLAEAMKEVEKYNEIGKLAAIGKERKFSIAFAAKDLKEEVEGYKLALEKGWISKEEYNGLCKDTNERHKEVVRLEISKKHKKKIDDNADSELREKSKFGARKVSHEKKRVHTPEWHREQVRLNKQKNRKNRDNRISELGHKINRGIRLSPDELKELRDLIAQRNEESNASRTKA